MSGARRKSSKAKDDGDEVDALLEAAQTMVLLDLTTDAHLARGNPLDPDLVRRFSSLKSPAKPDPPKITKVPPPPTPKKEGGFAPSKEDDEMSRILGDDLSARFAALKATSSSAAAGGGGKISGQMFGFGAGDGSDDDADGDEDGVSEREVKKLMQWAMDAARLDPSRSDDDDDDDGFDEDDEEISDEEDANAKKKQNRRLTKMKKEILQLMPLSIR